MALDLTSTYPGDWKYVSEGGSTIVFAYAGSPSRDFDGTVIRLPKAKNVTLEASHPTFDSGCQEPEDHTVVFQRRVIQRLIPSEFLCPFESVTVNEEWLRQLCVLTDDQRPVERRATDSIDVRRRTAVLAADLVAGEGFAVEIKPKWGFLPPPTFLSPCSKLIKTTTCRFCMHARLKSTEGKQVSSGYCPLDLYSGDVHRVKKALHALWDAWIDSSGGVNNLRVFVDGTALRPSTLPKALAPLARQLLSHSDREATLSELRDAFTAMILPALLQTPVLQKLSNLQRTLDPLDIEGLCALWSEAHATAITQVQTTLGVATGHTSVEPLKYGIEEPTLSEWENFLDIYLTKHITMDHKLPDVANLRYYCLAYVLSASLEDCSIIIKMTKGRKAKITVIDLDVKSVQRLHKWALLDAEIVRAYKEIQHPSVCVDQWASVEA